MVFSLDSSYIEGCGNEITESIAHSRSAVEIIYICGRIKNLEQGDGQSPCSKGEPYVSVGYYKLDDTL
jgi:hypothetical protein